jgi:hypothetical protein
MPYTLASRRSVLLGAAVLAASGLREGAARAQAASAL